MKPKTDVDNTGRETQKYFVSTVQYETWKGSGPNAWPQMVVRIKKTGTRPKEGGCSIASGGSGCGDAHSRSSNLLAKSLGS